MVVLGCVDPDHQGRGSDCPVGLGKKSLGWEPTQHSHMWRKVQYDRVHLPRLLNSSLVGLVAEYGVQRTGGWLMFPGNLTVYYYVKDSGREDDKGYCSEGRASVLMLMILAGMVRHSSHRSGWRISRWCGCNWLLLECGTTRPALLAEVVVTWALFAVVVVVGAMAVVVESGAASHCRLRGEACRL